MSKTIFYEKGKIRKNINNLTSADLAPRVVKVKMKKKNEDLTIGEFGLLLTGESFIEESGDWHGELINGEAVWVDKEGL